MPESSNYYERLAVNVAADLLTRIARTAELFLASGTNPQEPHQQKIAAAQIDALREKLADGRVRPWFTRELTEREKLQDYQDPTRRHKVISGAKDLDEVRRYYEDSAKLLEDQ